MLPDDVFEVVIRSTPLISLDIILKNHLGEVILGKRKNRPAKGYWFVPGGRVLKNETLEKAFKRLIYDELGLYGNVSSKFKGIYQHHYDDTFFGTDASTHYVVLAYEVNFGCELSQLPEQQHSIFKWFSERELLKSEQVHEYTKWYFKSDTQADRLFK